MDEHAGAVRTDAAVDPDGVVVLLRHAGVAAETVLRSYRLLDLRTERRVADRCWRKPLRGLLMLATHHARSAEDPGVETAGFSQHQHVLRKTNPLQHVRFPAPRTFGAARTIFFSSSVALTKPGSVRQARR